MFHSDIARHFKTSRWSFCFDQCGNSFMVICWLQTMFCHSDIYWIHSILFSLPAVYFLRIIEIKTNVALIANLLSPIRSSFAMEKAKWYILIFSHLLTFFKQIISSVETTLSQETHTRLPLRYDSWKDLPCVVSNSRDVWVCDLLEIL